MVDNTKPKGFGCSTPPFAFDVFDMNKLGLAILSFIFLAFGSLADQAADEPHLFIQVSSHETLDSAVAVARGYFDEYPNVSVHYSSSGYFAVTIAQLPKFQAERMLADLKSKASVPIDAYLTSGSRFNGVAWTARLEHSASTIDLMVLGEISVFSALDFERQLSRNINARTVVLDSPGGQVIAALVIARAIHNRIVSHGVL